MKPISVIRSALTESTPGIVATLGNFDGVHAGHRELVSSVVSRACERGLNSAVITFYPHPVMVLRGSAAPSLMTLRQKARALELLGIERLILQRFSLGFSNVSAEDFITQYLIGRFKVKHLIVGPDARVGRGGIGDVQYLRKSLSSKGIDFEVLDFLCAKNIRVSSARIRELILNGEVELAEELLGRPFAIEARARQGQQIGRTLSFPTINQYIKSQVLPKFGVYVTIASFGDREEPAVTNVGIRPTFGGSKPVVESYLLSVTAEMAPKYGQDVEIKFIRFLRPEIQFASIDELKKQISIDIDSAREIHAQRYT